MVPRNIISMENWIWDNARFWEDVRVGNNNLITLYPRLHSLSLDQGLTAGEVGE